jgi:PA14 domain/Dolichyl-phosphate-mannose-protein mannosyltransferase
MSKAQLSKPLFMAALSFVVAGFAQSAFGGPLNNYGWLLYLAATALFIAAFGADSVGTLAAGQLRSVGRKNSGHLSNFSWMLLGGTILAAAISFLLFGSDTTAPIAWVLHLASLLLLVCAFVPPKGYASLSLPSRQAFLAGLVRGLPMVAVFSLGTFARLWQLDHFPFGLWVDEADNGLAAAQILANPGFRPLYFDSTNAPAHFNYLVALAFSFLGSNALALRLVAATFGIAGLLFAYLLFRRWLGHVMGLVAACLLAVMRYHLTFSRFGVQVITTPTFELAALYFLDRALAGKKLADFAWLGLTLGFGLAFYTAYRLFPIALLLVLVGLFIAAVVRSGIREAFHRYVQCLSTQWIIAVLALLLAVAPVIAFAVRQPRVFFARTNTVSIFEKRDEPNLAKAIWSNTLKHLQMFNVRGDGNGRHNLPGAPMLDPVMGLLLVLGVAYGLWRWRDPPNALMLAVFFVMLLAGILSLDFEAPQSLRSIGVIPALVYFITLPIAVTNKALLKAMRRKNPPAVSGIPIPFWRARFAIWGAILLGLLAAATYANLNMFFVRQQNDPSAWASYSSAETLVANELNNNVGKYDFVLSALYYDPPTVRFLAGNVTNAARWTETNRLPLVRDNTDRGVIMMFDQGLLSAYNDARRFYPNAQFIEHHAPAGGGTVMYEVVLTPDDLRSVQGAVASYFQGDVAAGQPVKQEVVKQLSLDWSKSQPLAAPFVAELRSTLFIQQYGVYHFFIHGAPAATLWIDENPVDGAPVTLARGNHALRFEIPGGRNRIELWWQPPGAPQPQLLPSANSFIPPVTNSGLLGAYYPSPDWTGAPAFTQIDPEIAFYFHIIPLPRPYSVEWTGKLFAPAAGTYDFELYSVDGSQLTIDHNLVVDNPNGATTVKNNAELALGWHDITIRFSDKTSATQIYFYWTLPGASQRELVPSLYLSPPMGRYPTAP